LKVLSGRRNPREVLKKREKMGQSVKIWVSQYFVRISHQKNPTKLAKNGSDII